MSPKLFHLLQTLPGRDLSFKAGASVFHIGDAVRRVHFVGEGTVHLIRHQKDGSALILQRAGPASILAEASVYSGRYHCDARAETAAAIWAVPRNALRSRLSENPEFAEAWAHHLALEVQRARLHAEILSLKTVAARLDAWIEWHEILPAKGNWVTVAHEIGVSPEALYREFARRRA